MKVNGYNCTLEAICQGEENSQLAIIVHGFPDTPENWKPIINGLTNSGYKVICPWLRGYWPSQAAPPYNIGTIGLDILQIALDNSVKNDSIIIGHDFGAMGAYCAANLHPDLFSKIITMSVPPFGAVFEGFLTIEQLKKSWYIFFNQTFLAEAVLPMNDFAFIDQLWEDWSLNSNTDYKPFSRLSKACFESPDNITAALSYYRSLFDLSQHDDVRIVNALVAFQNPVSLPTLYMHGSNDGCIGQEVGTLATKYLNEQSKFKLIENAGHFLQIDKPNEILAETLKFLDE